MANDKHFRVKNGIKVGNTEIATSQGKVPASVVYVADVSLPNHLDSVSATLSSLSAALGSYEDAVSVLNLIETSQASASASLSATEILKFAASAAMSAALIAETTAEQAASDAGLEKQSACAHRIAASGFRVTAESHKQSASSSQSAALSLKESLDTLKASGSSTESAIRVLRVSASSAFDSADSARQAAEQAAGTAESEQASALAHARSAIFAASSALSAFLASQASASAAGSARTAAEIFEGNATDASVSAGNAAASAITQQGLAINARVAASAAASAAGVAEGLALIYSEDTINSRLTASTAAITAANKEILAVEASVNSQTAANDALAAKETASAAASAALSSETAATSSNSAARSAYVAASIFADNAVEAKQTASGAAVTAEQKRGLAVAAASQSSSSFSAANSAANAAADSLSSATSAQSAAFVSASAAKSSFTSAQNFATSAANSRDSASGSAASAEEKRILAANAASNSASSFSAANSAANAAEGSASSANVSRSSAQSSFAAAQNFSEDSANAALNASTAAATAESKRTLAATAASQSASSFSAANSAANAAKDSLSSAESAATAANESASSAQSSFAAALVFSEDSASAMLSASASAAAAESKRELAAVAASSASSSLSSANSAADEAASSASSAGSAFGAAFNFASDAADARNDASTSAASAESKRALAAQASSSASDSASSASASKAAAKQSEEGASAAASAALSSKNAASSSESSARSSFAAAEIFSQDSANAMLGASSSAATAESKRLLAAQASSSASDSASSASASKAAAADSASAALSSENAAFQSQSSAKSSFAAAEIFSSDAADARESASGSAATAESKRSLAATAASQSASSFSAANSAANAAQGSASSANVSRSSAKSSFAAAEIFAQDAADAASSSSSSRASAISAKDIAVEAANRSETSANTVNITSIAVLNPSRVGTDQNVWAYQGYNKDLDTNDSRFIQTGTFPNNSFITDDATFGNAFIFPDTENKTFGPRLSFAYGSDKVYLMTVTYRTVQDSDTLYGGQYGVRTLLGATTRGDNGVTLAENIQDFEQRTLASAGETVFAGVIHGEDYTDTQLDSLPIITSTLTTNQDSTITDRITTAHTFGQNAGASGPATSISFAIRQNAGESTEGQIAVKSFEVRDLTDIVKSQLATASAENAASAATSAEAAAGISASDAAQAKSDASSAAASAVSSKELSANSETAAANSASAANSARGAAVISQVAAANSESNASASKAAAIESKNLAAGSATSAQNSASSASASKAAAAISELNAANSESNASSSKASALSSKELSANSATLAGTAKDSAVSAQNAATEQAVENQNLIATGGFIGKNTFDDGDGGRWSKPTAVIADEGLPAHPLGRTRALKHNSRDAVYGALNGDSQDYYTTSPHGKTFRITGYVYNDNVAGAGQDAVHCNIGIRSNNGSSNVHPTVRAANMDTNQWVFFDKLLTVNDSDSQRFKPFLQNAGFTTDGDTLLSYWTDMTMEDVTASESSRKSASAANSARGAAVISESNAAESATTANSAEGAAEEARRLAASAQLAANKDASSAESARAAAEVFESDASQAKVDAEGAEANAEIARGLSVNAQTAAQAAETSVKVLSANPFFEFDEIGWKRHGGSLPSTFTSGTSGAVTAGKYLIAPQGNAGTSNDGYHWYFTEKKIPFDKDRYYKFTARFKAVSSNGAHFSKVYAGAVPFNAAGSAITGHVGGTHHYVTTKGQKTITADGNWHTYTNIVHGVDPDNSASTYDVMPLDTKFISPQFLVGWQTSNAEFTYIDEISVEDVTGEELAKQSASSAESSFGAADIARSEAVNAKTSASSSKVSANQASITAVNAKTASEDAANGALAAQAAALISEQNSANAETTATSAASSASSNQVLATSAAGAADQAATAALSSEQSASSFVDQLSGQLTTSVRDVNRISAEVQTGLNGHYVTSNQYFGHWRETEQGKGAQFGNSDVKAITGDIIPNTTSQLWGSGSFGFPASGGNFAEVTSLTNWVLSAGTKSVVGGDLQLNHHTTATATYTLTGLEKGATYKLSWGFVSKLAGTTYAVVLRTPGGTAYNQFGMVWEDTENLAHAQFTAKDTSVDFEIVWNNTVRLHEFFLAKVVSAQPAVPDPDVTREDLTLLDVHSNVAPENVKGMWQLQSSEGFVGTFGDGGIYGIPENFSSNVLGLSVPKRSDGINAATNDIRAQIYSPYADTTINVYAHVARGSNSLVPIREDIDTPIDTVKVRKGEVISYRYNDNSSAYDYDDVVNEQISLVFAASSPLLGYSYMHEDEDLFNVLLPLHSGDIVISDMEQSNVVAAPVFIRGKGVNILAVEDAIAAEVAGELASQAPALSNILNETNPLTNKKYGDISGNGAMGSFDADLVEDFRLNTIAAANYQHARKSINSLLEYLESKYSELKDLQFQYQQQTFNLFSGAPPESTTISKVSSGNTIWSSSDARVLFGVSAYRTGNQSHIAGIPVFGLSDTYKGVQVEELFVVSTEPNTIEVTQAVSGDSHGLSEHFVTTIDHSAATRTNPLQTKVTGFPANGEPVVNVRGSATFYCAFKNGRSDDFATAFGARASMLAQDSGFIALGKRVTETSSTVDSFTATVTETAESIDGLEANYSVKIDNNGVVSGFGLSSTGPNSESSAFVVNASRFALVDPSTYTYGLTTNPPAANIPFEVVSGTTLIKKAFIANLNAGNIEVGGLTGTNINATSRIEVFTASNKQATYAALDGTDPIYRLYAGNDNPAIAPFSVTSSGDLKSRSLSFRGTRGNYFTSEGGFGTAALQEIGDFVADNRRNLNTSFVLTGDLDPADSTTYQVIDFKKPTDLYQAYRLEAEDITFKKEVEYYSFVDQPIKVEFGATNSAVTKNLTTSNVKVPVVDESTDTGFSYSSKVLSRGAYVGEILEYSYPDLPAGSKLTGTGAVIATEDGDVAINNTPLGPNTPYPNSIKVRITAAGSVTHTISRPPHGNLNITVSTVAKPDVVASAKAEMPYKIELQPRRGTISGGSISEGSFMDGREGYSADGKVTFTAVEGTTAFTDLATQYRLVTTEAIASFNTLSATSSIDTRSTVETGAVDSEGFLSAWTTIFQTDEGKTAFPGTDAGPAIGANNIYGVQIDFYKANLTSLLLSKSHLDSATRIIESSGFEQYQPYYQEPIPRISFENSRSPEIRAAIRVEHAYIPDGTTNQIEMFAYGLRFSGGAFTILENDFRNHRADEALVQTDDDMQSIVLGHVNDDGINEPNLFTVNIRSAGGADFVSKMMLTSEGELYLKDNGRGTTENNLQVKPTDARVVTRAALDDRIDTLVLDPLTRSTINATAVSNASSLVFDSSGLNISQFTESGGTARLDLNTSAGTTKFAVYYNAGLRYEFTNTKALFKKAIHTESTLQVDSTSTFKNNITVQSGNLTLSSGSITASGNITAFSDERLKTDIKTLDGKKVLEMRGVEFIKDGEKGSGVIAQELEKVAPELVLQGEEYKSVSYGNIVGYLIEAIKDQQKQINELKEVIKNASSK